MKKTNVGVDSITVQRKNKGITLIALIITIIVMLILVMVSISIALNTGLFDAAGKATQKTNIAKEEEKELASGKVNIDNKIYNSIDEYIATIGNGGGSLISDGSWDGEVNSPKLGAGMTPIAWDEDGEEFTPTTNEEWYNYVDQAEGQDGTSNWANAVTEDGSYWVWIPRFAYKITSTTTDYTKAGTIDVVFLQGTSNKGADNTTYAMPTIDANTATNYIVHPAFCGTGYEELGGGFGTSSEGITGFWVAKYEMSMEGKTDEGDWTTLTPTSDSSTTAISGNVGTTNTIAAYNATAEEDEKISTSVKEGETEYTNIRAVSKPNVSSWRYINISNMYENAYNYNRSLDSHLMKNSEWGAVAYLTHSSYGRNGEEVDINDEGYISASGGEETSSTGNETGIYDLSGAAGEYVASFNDAYSSTGTYYSTTNTSYCSSTGKNMGETGLNNNNSESTKYLTAYSNNTSTSYQDFTVGKVSVVGDGIKEVYVSSYYGWNNDESDFVSSRGPFVVRGGDWFYEANAGTFFSGGCLGGGSNVYTFRVVCPL